MPKEFKPTPIEWISPLSPIPGHEAEIGKIRSIGRRALALVAHGGTARFQNEAGVLLTLRQLGLLPKTPSLQIGTSAGALLLAIDNVYDLSVYDNLNQAYATTRSMNGVVRPWSSLLEFSPHESIGLKLNLENFIKNQFPKLRFRNDFMARARESLIVATAGRRGSDGYIPALFTSQNILSSRDPETAIRRYLHAVEISATMPPILSPHKDKENGHTHADGGLPGHRKHGHRNFVGKNETTLAQSIMPEDSTIIIIDPLPEDSDNIDEGVYFEKDRYDRDIIHIVPTAKHRLFGRRNIDDSIRFHPGRFDMGARVVLENAPRIRKILHSKGLI